MEAIGQLTGGLVSMNARSAMPSGGKLTIEAAAARADYAQCTQKTVPAALSSSPLRASAGGGPSERFRTVLHEKPERGMSIKISLPSAEAVQTGDDRFQSIDALA
jgi:hypothetical protein